MQQPTMIRSWRYVPDYGPRISWTSFFSVHRTTASLYVTCSAYCATRLSYLAVLLVSPPELVCHLLKVNGLRLDTIETKTGAKRKEVEGNQRGGGCI